MKRKPSSATIIACVALFFSLTGAGFAASRYLITSVSQIKPSVRHALQGAAGPQGPQGPQGYVGPTGGRGAQGPQGPSGIDWSQEGLMSSQPNGDTLNSDGSETTFTASCNWPDRLLSGGFQQKGAVIDAAIPGQHAYDVTAHLAAGADPTRSYVIAWGECVPAS